MKEKGKVYKEKGKETERSKRGEKGEWEGMKARDGSNEGRK